MWPEADTFDGGKGARVDSLETLLYEEDDGVAIVTLNRPEVHNAFDQRMQGELRELWRGLRRNDDVRVVILTGAGEKAFCTGIDREESIGEGYLANEEKRLKMRNQTGPVSTPFQYNDPGAKINPKQNDMWKPVVAAVNGMACGGALYMLGEADIIVAAEHATFFDPHVTYGMVAGFESLHLLQKLPLGETLRVALLGAHERMSAARAAPAGAGLRGGAGRGAARARPVGGTGDRVGTGVRNSGHGEGDLDGPRALPARGDRTGVVVRLAGNPIREHRGRPGNVSDGAPRVAAPLTPGDARPGGTP